MSGAQRALRREKKKRLAASMKKRTAPLSALDEMMRMAETIKKLYWLLKVSWACAAVATLVAVAGWLR